ncbi:hypothetical protein PIROE2DRAFT_18259 [Piromyces sp. E2]|nr:hypothetical protein PIROE2DRAFT_18259 [Piromyces sp. E2]|eukprot:OUM56923.1 hypothetical protein PIROE2DRAFT_18259 [Piromyces sp. E2]
MNIINKNNPFINTEEFIDENDMISKSLIIDNKLIIVGVYICLYKKDNDISLKLKG